MHKIHNILLIDDDEIANYVHKLLIEDLHLADNIAVANNGEQGLHILREQLQADFPKQELLILLDLNMPVMDGFDFLHELENDAHLREQPIYIVILSSSNNQKDIEKARKYKVHGYVDKPLTEEKIIHIIQQINS